MKVIAAADLHLDSNTNGRWIPELNVNSNWIESYKQLRAVVDLCNEHDVDLLLLAGDLFDTGRPTAEAVARCQQELHRLKRTKVAVTNGNHDQASVVGNHRTPIDAYIADQSFTFHAAAGSETVEFDGLHLAFLPWHRVAGTTSLDHTSSILRDDIKRMADELSGETSLLFGHFTVDEASFNSGRRSSELLMSTGVLEASVPAQVLDDGPWALWRAGHIHKRQQITDRGGYIGSTYKVSFGEAEEAKGVDLIEFDSKGQAKLTFIPLEVRQLVQIESNGKLIDLEDELQERDVLRIMLPSGIDLASKANKTVDQLIKRGVEVQIRHLPKERTEGARKAISLDTSPERAFEIYAKSHLEDEKRRRNAVLAFGEVFERVSD